MFDLLSTVEYGGCSAKLPPALLAEALQDLPQVTDTNVLVPIDTHDDAGVYRISDECALIQTTDFFPPICSGPFEFGQIAAANALSDIYAMGGKALTALNLVMFPQTKIPLEVLREILAGGAEKVKEAGAVIIGGHTIDDFPPKYGLAVTGTIHPEKIITNAAAQPGDRLILTKALGTGIIVAGKRLNTVSSSDYQTALNSMKQLNKSASECMQQFFVRSATDITGFSLLGHALKMAQASDVTIKISSGTVPVLHGAYELAELGCIPGAAFRNQEFVEGECTFLPGVDYNRKMLMLDAQTSGGLLIAVSPDSVEKLLQKLRIEGCPKAGIIGIVENKKEASLIVET